MAVTNLILTALATNLYKNTVVANAASVIKASAGTLYAIYVDNSANAAEAEYLKLYDSAGAVVVGTTVPDFVFKIPAAFVGNLMIATSGIAFAAGLQIAAVTAGGTAGTTSPTASLEGDVVYT